MQERLPLPTSQASQLPAAAASLHASLWLLPPSFATRKSGATATPSLLTRPTTMPCHHGMQVKLRKNPTATTSTRCASPTNSLQCHPNTARKTH